MKKRIIWLMLSLLLCFGMAVKVNASDDKRDTIVGFDDFSIVDHYLYYPSNSRPEKSSLMSEMPKTLTVRLATHVVKEIEVDWFDVSGDYEEERYFYYQFSPKWDESKYILDGSIDLYKDGPYIGVFFLTNTEKNLKANSAKSGTVTGNSDETKVYNFLKNTMNVNNGVACGVLANIQRESSFDPDAKHTEDDGRLSYGICQWNGSRLNALKTHAGSSYNTIEGQLSYLKYELENDERSAWSIVKGCEDSATGAYNAGYNWAQHFERCSHYWCDIHGGKDYRCCEKAVDQYNDRGNLAKNSYWPVYGNAITITSDKTSMEPGDSVTITWTKESGASYTVVVYKKNSSGNYEAYGRFTNQTSPFVLSWSNAGEYQVFVQSTKDGVTKDSNKINISVVTKPGKASISANKTTMKAGDQVTITWSETQNTDSYTVVVYKKNSSGNYEAYGRFTNQSSPFVLSWSNAGEYQVFVQSCKNDGGCTDSNSVYVYVYQDDNRNRIDFDLQGGKVDGSFADYTASGINIGRDSGTLVIYNESGTTVETNQYGVEAAVTSSGVVSEIREYDSTTKLTVPDEGFVISGHVSDGTNGGEFVSKLAVGNYVGYDSSTLKVSAYKDLNSYLVENKYVQNGGTYGALPIPEKDGYIFEGWYTSAEGGDRIKSSTVYSTSRLYARWAKSENSSYVQRGKYNGHTYEVYDYSMSWKEAKELCESKGGHLVTITSKGENDFVTGLITKGYKGYYSIGCTDEEKEGTWKWVTGEAFSYSNWDLAVPEPNGGVNENYGSIIAINNPPNKEIGEWIDAYNKYLVGDFYSYTNSGFICEYDNILEITKQPEDISGKAGDEAALTIEADGEDLTYQWQESRDNGKTWTNCTSTGATASTFTFTLTSEMDGRKYRCIVSDGTYSITSEEATVTVEMNEPVITKQSEDISGKAGDEAALTVEAEGEDLTYQWQESSDNGKTWTNCTSTSATMSTFTFTLTSEMDGRKYRCIVTNSAGSVTSEEATVTVEMSKPVITKQPADITVNAGETTAVTVEAEGEDLTYQWQKSNDSGKTWSDCTSAEAKLASFAFKATAYMDGRQFRCIVTNGAGSVTSEAAVLTVNKAPAITRQPKDITVNAGETTAVTVEAEGEGLTYQWQKSNDSGKTWSNCTSAEAKLASFAFKATAYMDGRQFRCIVTNSVGSVTSKAAVLTINKAPVITSQPENVTGSIGDAAGVSVKATGDNLSYRWQKSYDSGKTWSNCTSASAAKATFSFTLAENMNGRMYRCVVSNENGSTTSSAVKVTVTAEAHTITKQPVSTSASVGEQVSMKVTAEGSGLKYQWQRSTDGGKTWMNCTSTGSTSATFTFTMAKNFDGRRFRCRVSNSGGFVMSSAASVTLKVEAPVITKQPANAASEEGGQITLSITATGENLKYQWQRSTDGGKTWVNCTSEGSTTNKFGFEMLKKFDGRMFRCKVSNSGGTVTSREVTVRII